MTTMPSFTVRVLKVVAAFSLASFGLGAQAQQVASDGLAHALSADAQKGAPLFRSLCGFCHGAEAGGAQGPSLVASKFFTQDDHGAALAEFLKSGRPAVGMPPFPTLAQPDIALIDAFVRSHAGTAQRTPMEPASILVGDAAAGKNFFEGEGHCVSCHSASGDLKDVGARFNPLVLQGRLINPRIVGVDRTRADPHPPQVTVTQPDGTVLTGELMQINDFFVTLKDSQGVRRTVARDNERPKVDVCDPAEAHRQAMLHLSDQHMWNLTAYLSSLK
jgi:cytochrome c oxidase cbb3-type subunit III